MVVEIGENRDGLGRHHGARTIMQVQFDIPDEISGQFSDGPGGISRAAALEALALEGIRSGRLTDDQARRLQ